MKKRIIIITSIIAIIIMIVSLSVMRYQRELKRQEEIQIEIMKTKNELYTYLLGIDGEFSYEPDRVIIQKMTISYFDLIQYIELYNEFCEENQVTVEQVLEEYENFCNGEGETEALDSIIDFDLGDEYLTLEYSYKTYTFYYTNYLMNECGLDNPAQATHEQLQEAAEYAAKRIHEEIENE